MQIYVSLRHVGGLGEQVTTDRPRYFDLDDNCIETGKMGSRKLGNRKIRFFRGLFRFLYFGQFCVALFLTISIFLAQFSRCPFSRCRFFCCLFSVAVISHIIFCCPVFLPSHFSLPIFPIA